MISGLQPGPDPSLDGKYGVGVELKNVNFQILEIFQIVGDHLHISFVGLLALHDPVLAEDEHQEDLHGKECVPRSFIKNIFNKKQLFVKIFHLDKLWDPGRSS